MNRKQSSVAQASPRARAGRSPAEITAALDTLVHGYRAESELYTCLRKLTWRQHDTLREGWDLERFGDLLEEKEDLLQMIGQIESVMKSAKSLVLSGKPSQCPDRWKLEKVLDQLTAMIEEIRIVEGANDSLLEAAPVAG